MLWTTNQRLFWAWSNIEHPVIGKRLICTLFYLNLRRFVLAAYVRAPSKQAQIYKTTYLSSVHIFTKQMRAPSKQAQIYKTTYLSSVHIFTKQETLFSYKRCARET